jgi:hypothetical protein
MTAVRYKNREFFQCVCRRGSVEKIERNGFAGLLSRDSRTRD